MAGLLDYLQNQKPVKQTGEGPYLRQRFPKLYGALGGLLGTAPDEFDGSVLDPLTAEVRKGAEMGYLPGLIAGSAPPMKGAAGLAGLAGMFVGKGSKTWDALSAAKAIELEKAGVDARKIWAETGTWKAPDGKWRQEIPDNMAKGRDYQKTPQKAFTTYPVTAEDRALMQPYSDMTKTQLQAEYSRTGEEISKAAIGGDMEKAHQLLADRKGLDVMYERMRADYGPASTFLKHGELGKAYPDVYNMHTRIAPDELSGNTLGQYMRETPRQGEQIMLKNRPFWEADKSMQLHEMQHAIQQREGWARGGSPESMQPILDDYAQTRAKFEQAIQQASAETDPIAASNAAQQRQFYGLKLASMKGVKDASLHDLYQRLAGEAEARATQARMPLDATQRRALFPADSYDVPMDQLIIRGLLK